MSKISWEAPCNVLREAEAIVNARSPYAEREEWAVTKQHHAAWCEPIIMVMQGLPAGSRVLDIGPGYGALAVAATLLGHNVTAVELFLDALEWRGIEWVHGDIQDNRVFPGYIWGGHYLKQFGMVIMAEVLEHLNFHPAEVFANISGALRGTTGAFIGSTPLPGVWPGDEPTSGDLPKWTSEHVAEDRHVRLYSQDEVAALLEDAGFEVLGFEIIGPRYLWRAQKAVAA